MHSVETAYFATGPFRVAFQGAQPPVDADPNSPSARSSMAPPAAWSAPPGRA
jgi:hypothetical protein